VTEENGPLAWCPTTIASISSVRVSKPLATNSASKKKVHNRFRRGSIFKKIRNKLKFVGANKAVLETGKVSAESTVPFCSQFLLVNEFQNKAKNPA
jgi:hypothetical protein